MAIDLSGMFRNLGGATDLMTASVMGPALPEDPSQRNAMQRAGVTNPLLQQFGQSLGTTMGREMGSPVDMVKKAMSSIDPSDPQAVLKIAAAIKDVDPVKAAQLIAEYKTAQEKASTSSYSASGHERYKGADGRLYYGTQMRDGKGNAKMLIMDMSGNTVDPTKVDTLGLVPVDKEGMTAQDRAEVERAKGFAQVETQRYENTLTKLDGIRDDNSTLKQAQQLLMDPNFDFTLWDQYAPDVLKTPQMLIFNQIRSQRGLDVVANGKFGALSEKELEVANRNAMPSFKRKEDALKWINERLETNNIMTEQLREISSIYLGGGTSMDVEKYLKQQEAVGEERRQIKVEQEARRSGLLEEVTPEEFAETKRKLGLSGMSDREAIEKIRQEYGGTVIKIIK